MPVFASPALTTSSLPIEQCKQLKEENKQLKLELQQLRDSSQMKLNLSDELVPQSSSSSSSSTLSTSSTPVVDPNKLNQRLKEIFREKITTFRNAVYLLTGYHVRHFTSSSFFF
jgi:regulator of replication initiation timing